MNDTQLHVDVNYDSIIEDQALQIASLLKKNAISNAQVQALGAKVIELEALVERYEAVYQATSESAEAPQEESVEY